MSIDRDSRRSRPPSGYETTSTLFSDAEPYSRPQLAHGPGSAVAKRGGKLNLRAVAEVLDSYGLDPIEEIAKAVVQEEPLLDRNNEPILDENGKPKTRPVLDRDARLRTLLELAQYSRPKLKAVEVTNKTPELTDEQIDRRLDALLRKDARK